MLAEDETSVRVLLLQGGEPLAKLVMRDLDENSNLQLTVEVLWGKLLLMLCITIAACVVVVSYLIAIVVNFTAFAVPITCCS